MRSTIKSIIRPFAKILGNILVFLLPKKANQLSKNRITLIHKNKKNLNIIELLMRYTLLQKLEKIDDHSTIAQANKEFWINNNATELFIETEDTFHTDFLPNCTFIFDLLKNELSNHTQKFDTIVEIGTGNGDVLNYLSLEFPQINHLIGIDLSQQQTKLNNIKFKNNNKLEFIAYDAFDWVKKHGQANTIFVSSRGVLEYFLEQQLQDFLKEINQLGNTIFIAIEPNGADHNFDTQPNTQLYGDEPSFSHNYPKLFKNAGFNLWHFSQKTWFKGTNIQTFIGAKNYK
ncbi:class I SAM-dependent methyltransferase [Psychroserpens damuponensis]|uniref:class I SAM-dependent methyltransferase n=1 Tax=Psychroserpens damuponensis TaxID=943936 RepID=UPI00058E5FC4|nr:class I SAM-dependent methyltransferase [Psychroserpens damuponensis]